jgi:cyclopropane-fatty-acyl-phospholipid synthase
MGFLQRRRADSVPSCVRHDDPPPAPAALSVEAADPARSGLIDRTLQAVLGAAREQLERVPFPFAISWPGGWLGARQPELRFHFQRRPMLWALAQGDVGELADAYVRGDVDFHGNVRQLMQAVVSLAGDPVEAARAGPLGAWWRLHCSRQRHRAERDALQIRFHYDVSDAFYALWLDPQRVYSCAYWPAGVEDLAAAQEAKLDLICRKLRLQPGQRLLDIGAGWGALLLWAARYYGVTAHGITLSRHQYAHVQGLIDAQGLAGRVHMHLLDYRDVADQPWASEPFDRIASVGMFEHVGLAQLPTYFYQLHRLLAPGGLVINHGITAGGVHNHELGAGIGEFVERHIFPGGELVHVSQVAAELGESGLELLDLENLRPHYARTLWAWSDALESQLDVAATLVAPGTLRAYRLYLSGCAAAFEQGWISINQLLASRPDGYIDGAAERRLRGAQSDYPFERGEVYAARL